MAAIYLACAVGGALMVLFNQQIAESEPQDEPWLWILYGGALMLLGLVLAAVYVYAFFAPARPWAWIYHLVLICLGLTSCCCMPASIPLLVFWLRPTTQRYFGRA